MLLAKILKSDIVNQSQPNQSECEGAPHYNVVFVARWSLSAVMVRRAQSLPCSGSVDCMEAMPM